MRSPLLRTVFLLGTTYGGHVGHITLTADGRVHGVDDPERARFGFQNNFFYFLNEAGEKQARLRFHPEALSGAPDDYLALYLVPLLTLGPPRESVGSARLLVNTIPKSGTYLLDRVLTEMGYHSLGLHLVAGECHDNRGVPSRAIHRDPQKRRMCAPAAAVTRLMAPGEFAVGHVERADEVAKINAQGVGVINCRRDLRDVLASLFRFKRDSVDPQGPADHLWRALAGREAFAAYLCAHAPYEIADIRAFAQVMPAVPGVHLRFEDMVQGVIPAREREALEAFDAGLGVMMEAVLPECVGQESSTYSGKRSDWRELWSPAAEAFLQASGLAEANRGLGYEG